MDYINNIILEDRKKLFVSGVIKVGSFNEEKVTLYVKDNSILVTGNGMHITKLSIETQEVSIEGAINSIQYTNKDIGKSIVKKIFK